MTRHRPVLRGAMGILVALALSFALVPSAQAAVVLPPQVAADLATFPTDSQGAMTAWVEWARTQPMTFRNTAPGARLECRIDAAGVSRCHDWAPRPSGRGWQSAGVTYTLADHRTQVFRFRGTWVKNSYGADTNPFSNASRFYPYDYWLPWATPGVPVSTWVAANGWYVVQAQNLHPGDDQSPVTMVQVSPDGLHAKFLQQDQDGTVESTQTITLRDVPAIRVPHAVKQKL